MKRLLITFEFWLLVFGTAVGTVMGIAGSIQWFMT